MNLSMSLIISVVASLIASIIFWLLTFKYSGVMIEFSPEIEKSKLAGEYPGIFRYRIKIKNVGRRSLQEISPQAKLVINGNYTTLGIGNNNQLPILAGRKRISQYKNKLLHTLTMFLNKASLNQYKKSFIRILLEKRQITEI